ncbi:MAG: type II toxin-antitoxin system RelE/ParE family toxin [Chloroflexi bacterium]|nr:type II toxin-antitoxin system RelE/ParE family toxin [Chloroflexota bacterium]
MKVVWTDVARADLRAIRDYIASDSPVFGARVFEAIMRRVDQLEQFPRSGRSVPEYDSVEVRELIEGAYRIIYFAGEEEVSVLGVVHGARSLDR